MNPSIRKKLVLCLRSGHVLAGFAEPEALSAAGQFQVLMPQGRKVEVAGEQLLAAYFVGEFVNVQMLASPAPRGAVPLPGVRVRCRTLDHQTREGLLATDLLHLEAGVELTPPFAECSWQRVYIPRGALEQFSIIGVVRPPRRRRAGSEAQRWLFPSGEKG